MAAGLRLIGMGPGGISGMTLAAVNAAKECDYRMYEAYTALWNDVEISTLENKVGKIQKIMRPQVENPVKILKLAKESLVAVLIVGDPLQATTHVDLQLRAVDSGIKCEIIHGVSITTLVTGAIGLSNYKFGRQTTLTYSYENWIATSPLEIIAINKMQGLHTLVLLDLDPTGEGIGNQVPMQPVDALQSILLMQEKLEDRLSEFPNESLIESLKLEACREMCSNMGALRVVLCTDMGTDKQNISYIDLEDLKQAESGHMHCLVIPGEINEIENDALNRWTKK